MIAGLKKICILFSIHKKRASRMEWQDSNNLAAQVEEAVIALLLRVRLCCLPRIQPALFRVPWQISLLSILKNSMKNKNSYFEKFLLLKPKAFYIFLLNALSFSFVLTSSSSLCPLTDLHAQCLCSLLVGRK